MPKLTPVDAVMAASHQHRARKPRCGKNRPLAQVSPEWRRAGAAGWPATPAQAALTVTLSKKASTGRRSCAKSCIAASKSSPAAQLRSTFLASARADAQLLLFLAPAQAGIRQPFVTPPVLLLLDPEDVAARRKPPSRLPRPRCRGTAASASTRASRRTRSSSPPSANTAAIRSCRTPLRADAPSGGRRGSRSARRERPLCSALVGFALSKCSRRRAQPQPVLEDQADDARAPRGAARTDPWSRSASRRSRRSPTSVSSLSASATATLTRCGRAAVVRPLRRVVFARSRPRPRRARPAADA